MIEGWLEHSSIGEDLQCYLMFSGKVQKIHGTPNCSLKMGNAARVERVLHIVSRLWPNSCKFGPDKPFGP